MGRQPLISASCGCLRAAPLALLGCQAPEPGLPWFDGPVGAAVLDPADGGPFDEPVGFVSNSRSGTIVYPF